MPQKELIVSVQQPRFRRDIENIPKYQRLEILSAFRDQLEVFLENPTNPILRNHSLEREWQAYHSINAAPESEWRAIYRIEEREDELIALFERIGRKKDLYRQ